jgi:hypothetical protein
MCSINRHDKLQQTSYGLMEYDCHRLCVERKVVMLTVCVGTSKRFPTVKETLSRRIWIGEISPDIYGLESSFHDHLDLEGVCNYAPCI